MAGRGIGRYGAWSELVRSVWVPTPEPHFYLACGHFFVPSLQAHTSAPPHPPQGGAQGPAIQEEAGAQGARGGQGGGAARQGHRGGRGRKHRGPQVGQQGGCGVAVWCGCVARLCVCGYVRVWGGAAQHAAGAAGVISASPGRCRRASLPSCQPHPTAGHPHLQTAASPPSPQQPLPASTSSDPTPPHASLLSSPLRHPPCRRWWRARASRWRRAPAPPSTAAPTSATAPPCSPSWRRSRRRRRRVAAPRPRRCPATWRRWAARARARAPCRSSSRSRSSDGLCGALGARWGGVGFVALVSGGCCVGFGEGSGSACRCWGA